MAAEQEDWKRWAHSPSIEMLGQCTELQLELRLADLALGMSAEVLVLVEIVPAGWVEAGAAVQVAAVGLEAVAALVAEVTAAVGLLGSAVEELRRGSLALLGVSGKAEAVAAQAAGSTAWCPPQPSRHGG